MIERWAQQSAGLWSVTSSCKIHQNFIFTWKIISLSLLKFSKALKPFWLWNWVSLARVAALLPITAQSNCCRIGNNLCLWLAVRPAKAVLEWAPVRPKQLNHWFCTQNLRLTKFNLPFETVLGSDGQMTGKDCQWNLDSNLNSATWSTICKSLSALKLKLQNKLCGLWICQANMT